MMLQSGGWKDEASRALRRANASPRRDRQMETKPAQNIQDAFLNNARRDKSAITIYLLSGVKLTGRIKSFDKYSVVLDTSNNQEQLIFKHAISTVVTSKAAQQHGERTGLPAHSGAPISNAPAATAPSNPGNES
jgi:host factor-I protein